MTRRDLFKLAATIPLGILAKSKPKELYAVKARGATLFTTTVVLNTEGFTASDGKNRHLRKANHGTSNV